MIRRALPGGVHSACGASYASAQGASIGSWAVRGRAVQERQAKAERGLRTQGRTVSEVWTKSKRKQRGRLRVRGTTAGSSSYQ